MRQETTTDIRHSIHLHATILDLFRPFLLAQPHQALRLGRFAAENSTPAAIYAASVNQLKHIILVFRTRFSCAATSILWHNALLYVANACLPLQPSSQKGKESHQRYQDQDYDKGQEQEQSAAGSWAETALQEDDDRRRVWFLACMAGYLDLAPRFNLITQIVPGLLSIAILKRQMTPEEGRALMNKMKAKTEHASHFGRGGSEQLQDGAFQLARFLDTGTIDGLLEGAGAFGHGDIPISPAFAMADRPEGSRRGSPFMVDLNTASINPSAATNDALASTFNKLAMFDDL